MITLTTIRPKRESRDLTEVATAAVQLYWLSSTAAVSGIGRRSKYSAQVSITSRNTAVASDDYVVEWG